MARPERPEATKVLVIDDEPEVCRLYRDILATLGYRIDAVTSGIQGVAWFAAVRHDVVMTDLRMPDWSGWEVIERLRSIDPSVKIILATGSASPSDFTRATAERIVLLEKPVSIDMLSNAIATVLSQSNP